jgi:predicted DCC family thiol-disulfide oxidoreductase YuxK
MSAPTVPVVTFTIGGVPRDGAGSRYPDASVGLGRAYTVIYDGDCKVCTRLSRALERWDRKRAFEIIPSQATGVHARFPWIPARAYAESIQVVDRAGHTWQGARALEMIIDALPKGRLVSWVFSIPYVRPLVERFYRWFARNRYRLGCGEHCSYRGDSVLEYEEKATQGG